MTEQLPRHTCDTHLHIFGDAAAYPAANRNALYAPPQDCTFAEMKALHDAMGVERAVFVQPTIYGTDHRLMYDVLKSASQRDADPVAGVLACALCGNPLCFGRRSSQVSRCRPR